MSIVNRIVQVAKSYIGQTEIRGNRGFTNKAFQAKMVATGWKMSQSWCAYFTELVWKQAYGTKSKFWKTLDALFSPSATATYNNFAGHATAFKVGKTPKLGALAVWRYGNGWQGHIGVVTGIVNATTFKSTEGNTNAAGGREGIMVAEKTRKTGEPFKAKGLNLIGFVYPEEETT